MFIIVQMNSCMKLHAFPTIYLNSNSTGTKTEGTTKLVKREFVKCFFGFAWLKSASVTGITIDVPQFHNTIAQHYLANSSVHNMNSNQTEQWFFFSNCRTNSS